MHDVHPEGLQTHESGNRLTPKAVKSHFPYYITFSKTNQVLKENIVLSANGGRIKTLIETRKPAVFNLEFPKT